MRYFDELDFNDEISHEPIYYTQFLQLKRLTDLPNEKILSLTKDEASIFIDSLRRAKINSAYAFIHQKREIFKKFGRLPREEFFSKLNNNYKAQVYVSSVVEVQSTSSSTQVAVYQTRIVRKANSKAKT